MITAVYVRVSTAGQNLENQLPDLRRWAKANDVPAPPDDDWLKRLEPWRGGNALWVADEYTGRSLKRPGMKLVVKELEAGKLARIVAWRLDRIGRTAAGLSALFEDCHCRGVNVITLRDGVDLSTPAGRLIAGVLSSIAQFETESMKDRQAAKIAIDRQRQRDAHDLRKLGLRVEQIAARIGVTHAIVERMLAKPKGTLWYGGRPVGTGRLESCSDERVIELRQRGMSMPEVAAVLKVSLRTIERRCKELRQKGKL